MDEFTYTPKPLAQTIGRVQDSLFLVQVSRYEGKDGKFRNNPLGRANCSWNSLQEGAWVKTSLLQN